MQNQTLPTIATVNQKGQLVIPKKLRDQLNITPQTPLYIQSEEGEIIITLQAPKYPSASKNLGLLKVLEETRGAWGPATKEDLEREKKQRAIDLEAAKKAKKAW